MLVSKAVTLRHKGCRVCLAIPCIADVKNDDTYDSMIDASEGSHCQQPSERKEKSTPPGIIVGASLLRSSLALASYNCTVAGRCAREGLLYLCLHWMLCIH